ncbi:hypothetical protein BKA63DRAFT_542957 [Paraphoma chrysanthemicola]|nr:hypothetical protein BKA63DRAFT_542957 [Paraphoma chrysanthemicola]
MQSTPIKIGVVGATGFVGSHACVELLSRGHSVIGFSRHPEALGSHKLYTPQALDVVSAKISYLSHAFRGLDVLVNAYGPHATGPEGLNPLQFIEISRKIVLAARDAKVNYTIMIGGCGSLNIPGESLETCVDSEEWWIAYRRGMADSPAHLAYMEERFGPGAAKGLKAYHDARVQAASGKGTAKTQSIIESQEKDILADQAMDFIKACRATFLFFDGNNSFRWSFLSPPTLFRSGKRTGGYEVVIDKVPLKGDQNDGTNLTGRLHGIAASDLAIAIADESEKQSHLGKHWSPYSDISDESPTSAFVTLEAVR